MRWSTAIAGGLASAIMGVGYSLALVGIWSILNADPSDDEAGMAFGSGSFMATVYGGAPLALFWFLNRAKLTKKERLFLGILSVVGLALLPAAWITIAVVDW